MGQRALALLWAGTVVGLAAAGLTLLYAARQTDTVGPRLARLEAAGLSGARQRKLLALCWGAYCPLLFGALCWYAVASPRTLGWGGSSILQHGCFSFSFSFGLMRLCLLLGCTCLAGSLLPLLPGSASYEAAARAWVEATKAEPRPAKKARARPCWGCQPSPLTPHPPP